ncbi:hypothetical protein ACIQZO_39100 [Streptomyces sp. NPDC097617]|uniref:hypothetical protein n=1 Tax=Streptomyces sp. NPDC097617 TaxID=3366091 RepID=UPI003815443A
MKAPETCKAAAQKAFGTGHRGGDPRALLLGGRDRFRAPVSSPPQGISPLHHHRARTNSGVLVLQEQDRTEHVATEKELAEANKDSWIRIPRYDYTPSERLRIVLSGGQPHRADEWSDTPPGRPLEDQLAEIAQEVTLRGQAAEPRRLDEIEAARQKRIRWEAAMEEARIQYAEAYRVRHFEAQEAAWRHATRLTQYVSAVRTRVEAIPPGQTRTEAEAWMSRNVSTEKRMGGVSQRLGCRSPPLQDAHRHTDEHSTWRQPKPPMTTRQESRRPCVTSVGHASRYRT